MAIVNLIFKFGFYSDTLFLAIIVFVNDQHQLSLKSWSNFVDFHLDWKKFNLTIQAEFSFIRLESLSNLQTLSSIPFPLIKLVSLIWTRIDFDLWKALCNEELMFPLSFPTTCSPSVSQSLVSEDDNLNALCW